MKLQYCKPRKKLKNIFSFSTLWRISTVCKFQGPRELQKSGWAKSPILPHFSENSSFIAFLCDNFFGFSKSGGVAAPAPWTPWIRGPCVRRGTNLTQTLIPERHESQCQKIVAIALIFNPSMCFYVWSKYVGGLNQVKNPAPGPLI